MTVNFENCFNLEWVIMPYSDSLESPETSQPLKAINSTIPGAGRWGVATVKVMICNWKFTFMYMIFYSQALSERAAGPTFPTWGTETVSSIILGPKWGPKSSDSKPKVLSDPVHLTSMPSWALASVSSFLIFPLAWSYGQYDSVLKENLKFCFHFKHSVIDHSSSPSSLQPSMPRDPSVPYDDNLWLGDRGGHVTQGQRPSIDVPGQPASLLQEFDLRDTGSVVGLMESPGAESPDWLGGWGGYFGVIWKMTKRRELKMCGKRESQQKGVATGRQRRGLWVLTLQSPWRLTVSFLSSNTLETAHAMPTVTPHTPLTTPSSVATSQALCNSKGLGISPRLTLSPSPSGNPGATCVSSLVCSDGEPQDGILLTHSFFCLGADISSPTHNVARKGWKGLLHIWIQAFYPFPW